MLNITQANIFNSFFWQEKKRKNYDWIHFQHKMKTEARKKLFSLPLPTETVRILKHWLFDAKQVFSHLKMWNCKKFFLPSLRPSSGRLKRSFVVLSFVDINFPWFWCWSPREFFSAIIFHQIFEKFAAKVSEEYLKSKTKSNPKKRLICWSITKLAAS